MWLFLNGTTSSNIENDKNSSHGHTFTILLHSVEYCVMLTIKNIILLIFVTFIISFCAARELSMQQKMKYDKITH